MSRPKREDTVGAMVDERAQWRQAALAVVLIEARELCARHKTQDDEEWCRCDLCEALRGYDRAMRDPA